jgi:hypothetical protein
LTDLEEAALILDPVSINGANEIVGGPVRTKTDSNSKSTKPLAFADLESTTNKN